MLQCKVIQSAKTINEGLSTAFPFSPTAGRSPPGLTTYHWMKSKQTATRLSIHKCLRTLHQTLTLFPIQGQAQEKPSVCRAFFAIEQTVFTLERRFIPLFFAHFRNFGDIPLRDCPFHKTLQKSTATLLCEIHFAAQLIPAHSPSCNPRNAHFSADIFDNRTKRTSAFPNASAYSRAMDGAPAQSPRSFYRGNSQNFSSPLPHFLKSSH